MYPPAGIVKAAAVHVCLQEKLKYFIICLGCNNLSKNIPEVILENLDEDDPQEVIKEISQDDNLEEHVNLKIQLLQNLKTWLIT